MSASKTLVSGVVLAAVIGLIIGGLIGHLGTAGMTKEEEKMISTMEKLTGRGWDENDEINQRLVELVDSQRIRSDHKELTLKPHLAGSERDNYLAKMIQKRFQEAGFDTADLVPYNVLLSFPDPENPNLITLEDAKGTIIFTSTYKEVPLHKDDADPNFIHAFNAYTPAGEVETEMGGGLVYVNYGREEDFEKLTQMGVNVSGTIVIARYGKIFRGNKVLRAQQRGAKGVILFSDPNDVAQEGTEPEKVYPNTWWLPGSGMQRGTTFMQIGDPLTPGWPSTEDAYRIKEEDADLAKIPCQPIGYDDARIILKKMGGTPAPEGWQGGLKGIAYNLGPQMLGDIKLRLTTHNYNAMRRSFNVIGTITGSVEPDRYVIAGNHRDAWGYGASDPSSGTAQLLETTRVLGVLLSEGWRPRRTLVFCSWGAEEHGLIGSMEWVEEHVSKLQDRAVVHVNADTCTSGTIFAARGSPLLWEAIYRVTKLMPAVDGRGTLYNAWAEYHAHWNRTVPEIKMLGSGSDHAPFAVYAGIPSMAVNFRPDKRKHDITYPSYHTGYETFYMVDKLLDPGFKITQGCSRMVTLTLRYFLDVPLLPYHLPQLPKTMKEGLEALKKTHGETLLSIDQKFAVLEEALDNLTEKTQEFDAKLQEKANELDPLALRAVNDQLMKMEQLFLLPAGLPGRPQYRHSVFAPSQFDSYASSGFPGLIDLLYKIDELQGEERAKREEEIRKHVSQLTIFMQAATTFLKDLQYI